MLARLKSLAGQSAIYGIGNLLAQGINFLLLPVYGHYMSSSEYGILTVVTTLNTILGYVLQFGMAGAVTRFHYDYLDDERERRAYYGTIWIFLTLGSLALTLLLEWQGDALFALAFRGIAYRPYGQLALWLAFVTVASVIPLVLFRVREQPILYSLFTVGRFVLSGAAVVFFVIGRQEGAAGALRGQLYAGIAMVVPYTWVALRNLRPALHWKKLAASLAFGLPLIVHQLSGWALQMSDRVVMERYLPLAVVGVYGLGYRVGQVLDMIITSVNLAWSPFFMRTAATEHDAPRTFARLTTYLTIGMLTLALAVALLARDIVQLFATPEYEEAYRVVQVVVLAFLAHGFYYLLGNQLFYAKRTAWLSLYTALSAGVNIGLNLLTLERFGMMAAAWNTVIGYVLLLLLVFWESKRVYPVPFEYRRLGVLLLLAGLCYLPGHFVQLPSPYLDVPLKLVLVALFPALLFAVRFFTPREREGMRAVVAGLRQRLGRKRRSRGCSD